MYESNFPPLGYYGGIGETETTPSQLCINCAGKLDGSTSSDLVIDPGRSPFFELLETPNILQSLCLEPSLMVEHFSDSYGTSWVRFPSHRYVLDVLISPFSQFSNPQPPRMLQQTCCPQVSHCETPGSLLGLSVTYLPSLDDSGPGALEWIHSYAHSVYVSSIMAPPMTKFLCLDVLQSRRNCLFC